MKKKSQGAVSIFLVIILVPCIVLTSIFVDLGRIHISKGLSYSSADLALNTLMTNYDADLNEWYGMVSSCQTIEEFYDISSQFFLRSLSSQGLSDDEIYTIFDYTANFGEEHFGDEKAIADLLQIECKTSEDKIVGEAADANLTNPTLIKRDIIEFMKYRAPVELTLGLIDRLKKDSSMNDAKDTSQNENLINKKTDYYETEGRLLKAAFNSYAAIYDYYSEANSKNITSGTLNDYAEKLTKYKSAYEQIHKYFITNLINTGSLSVYSRPQIKLDSYNSAYTEKSSDIYTRKEEDVYYINDSRITSLLDDLENKESDFETAIQNFNSAASSLMSKLPGNGNSDSNEIQWWVQMNSAVNSSSGTNYTGKVKSAGEDMLRAYSKVLAIKKCQTDDDVSEGWESRYNELTAKAVSLQNKYLITDSEISSGKGSLDKSDVYVKAVTLLSDTSSKNINNIKASNLYVNVDGNKNLNDALYSISSDLSTMRNNLQKCIDYLNIAIDGNESDENVPENDRVKSLDGLLTLVSEYKTSLNTWKDTAYDTDTQMGKDDQTEIQKMKEEQLVDQINEEAVRELKTRLTNIRSKLSSLAAAIDGLTYGGVCLKDISSIDQFRTAALTVVSESSIGLSNSELSSYSSSTYKQLIKPETDFALEHKNDNAYDPVINPQTGSVDTPKLFMYYYKRFEGPPDKTKDELASKEEELSGAENLGNNKKDEATKKEYNSGGSDISKDFSADETFDLGSGLEGMIELFSNLVTLDLTSMRDDLYTTTYVMEMFSYSTYENEGLYSLVQDKSKLNLLNHPSEYAKVRGDANLSEEDQKNNNGTWLSVDYEDHYNKSLTNKLINLEHNTAYGAEVEYVLYGGTNASNISSAYGQIFAIRYALNLVSGFANYWSPSKNPTAALIETIAVGIQAATAGIIPTALTKVILIPILTVFETAMDLARLEAGFPVELYKVSDDDWWIKVPDPINNENASVSDFTNILNGGGENDNSDNGLFYSDYLTVFVYLGFSNSKTAGAMYQRTAEVIQSNMRKLTGKQDYSMAKSRQYFTLDAQIRVKPLMITLPYFNEYPNDLDKKDDWCTYTIHITRGYA